MKRKTLTLTLCLLVCLSLIGVGFASWIITKNVDENVDGNIVVDVVEDQRYSIETEWVGSKNSLVFGYDPNVTQVENAWLTNTTTDTTKNENLTVTLKVIVKNAGAAVDKKPVATISIVDDADTNWAKAKAANLVTDPTATVTKVEGEGNTGVYNITITAAWGTAFDSTNPYTYYNNLEAIDANMDAASTNLKMIEALSSITFKLNIKVTA